MAASFVGVSYFSPYLIALYLVHVTGLDPMGAIIVRITLIIKLNQINTNHVDRGRNQHLMGPYDL